MVLLSVYSSVVIGYRIFEPEKSDVQAEADATMSGALDYSTLKDYTLASGASATHYYFFCTSQDNDCLYLESTVMPDVQSGTSLDLSSLIERVDVSSLMEKPEDTSLLDDWNVHSYPAFAAAKVQDGVISVLNTLEWNPEHPLNADDIRQWLAENGLIQNSPAPTK